MVFISNPNAPKEKIYNPGWEQKGFSTILSIETEHTAVCITGDLKKRAVIEEKEI